MNLDSLSFEMRELIGSISSDLKKSEKGNKAASQRVRTNTIKFAKTAKLYRKESILTQKKATAQVVVKVKKVNKNKKK